MLSGPPVRIALDYGKAGTADLLANMSGVAAEGERLWTVSDEGRSVECLGPDGNGGFVIESQTALDDVIADIPGADKGKELDLEAIDIAGGVLWLAGSHCRVRKEIEGEGSATSEVRDRPSRQLLARLEVVGAEYRGGRALPFKGQDSLRGVLGSDNRLVPYLGLPTKENGLDIEGMAVVGNVVRLGLRGPVVDGAAGVVRLEVDDKLSRSRHSLALLDLGGLGIRDLCRTDDGFLVLAGPVGKVGGSFRLHHWRDDGSDSLQQPDKVYDWPAGGEKPEGICPLTRQGRPGFLVVYDEPAAGRVTGGIYEADWLPA